MSINSINSKNKLENVLIIGNGGRENSLAWAIQKNELIKRIYLLPGNAGSTKINKSERLDLDLNEIKILIDKKSLLYIAGTTLDFSGGLNGKGFVFNNPNAKRTCGCGESFAI